MASIRGRRVSSASLRPEATACGTVTITAPDSGDDGDGSTPQEPPTVPYIGELTLQNPRAIAAGFGTAGFLLLLTG